MAHIYSFTVTPIALQEPAIIFTAASIVVALRSFILIFAISSSCSLVISATLSLLGTADPFDKFNAFLINTGAGGDLITNEKLLSS
mgnify:CR=1 FL=1